jgi:hypothetical protein
VHNLPFNYQYEEARHAEWMKEARRAELVKDARARRRSSRLIRSVLPRH